MYPLFRSAWFIACGLPDLHAVAHVREIHDRLPACIPVWRTYGLYSREKRAAAAFSGSSAWVQPEQDSNADEKFADRSGDSVYN